MFNEPCLGQRKYYEYFILLIILLDNWLMFTIGLSNIDRLPSLSISPCMLTLNALRSIAKIDTQATVYQTGGSKSITKHIICCNVICITSLSITVRDYLFQKASFIWSHSPCWARNGSLLSSSFRHQHSPTRLEKAKRTPGSHLDTYRWSWSEAKQRWPLPCLASSARPKRVEPTCADSYAPVRVRSWWWWGYTSNRPFYIGVTSHHAMNSESLE